MPIDRVNSQIIKVTFVFIFYVFYMSRQRGFCWM